MMNKIKEAGSYGFLAGIVMLKQSAVILMSTFFMFACGNKPLREQRGNSDAFIETVSAEKFKNLVDGGSGIILDVRTPEEIAGGHIANAQTVDVNDRSFTKKIRLLPKDREVYVYCRSGKRSLRAAGILRKNGFTRIYNLENGITGWEEKGFPVVKP
jgi:rhodanese-related sulfurtransferase